MAQSSSFQTATTLRFAVIAALVFLVAGCDDDDVDDSESLAGDSQVRLGGGSGGSATFSIGGSLPSQILADEFFSFSPIVSNPDGGPLTFSVSNLPSWASINRSTGEITGTPGAGDVGNYSGIEITATGGGDSVKSPAYSLQVVAVAFGSATLSWIPPTENTDGSALTDLAGYRVYWGRSPSELNNSVPLNNAGIATYMVEQLTPATWYFSVTAVDADGLESSFSNVASKTII